MTDTLIHLPQTDATGLSESWLFKHCGEMHWEHLCAAMGVGGVNSEQMRDDAGHRLYPTFVAIRGRYAQPLCVVRMDEQFSTTVELHHFGRAFFHSAVTFRNEVARFDLEMLTTFVARNKEGLQRITPVASRRTACLCQSEPLRVSPPILKSSQALRHADVKDYEFLGYHFSPRDASHDLRATYEPSPYVDYNGAGLLYFAAYPGHRRHARTPTRHRHGLDETGRDWALRTSTVARDVFYFRNLNLGGKLTATLKRFDRVGANIVIHTLLADAHNGAAIADIFTAKRVLD